MGRILCLGAGAIVLVGAALGAAVWYLTEPGNLPGPGSQEDAATIAEASPAPSGGPTPRQPPAPSPAMPSNPDTFVGRRPRLPGDLFNALGPLGASVARCAARSAPAAPAGSGPAVLVLDLEPLEGRVRILSASPLPGSSASEALVGCARAEMVGREVLVAGTRPGKPYKMSYSPRQ